MATYTGADKRLSYLFQHSGGGGGSANIWTGTRAEYEAQASQIPDDTAVFITDDEIQSLIISNYAVYSTDEKEVGTWIDGSTLYRKSFVFTNSVTVSHENFTDTGFSISGIDKIIFGNLYRAANMGYISGDFSILNTNHIAAKVLSNLDLDFAADSVLTVEYTKAT